MLRERVQILSRGMGALDVAVLATSYFLAHSVLQAVAGPPSTWREQTALLLSGVVFLVCLYLLGGYRSLRQGVLLKETLLVAQTGLLSGLCFPLFSRLLRAELTPGIELWLFFPIAFLNVSLARMSVRGVLRLLRSRGYNQRFYLIAGSGKRAQEIGEEISRQASWGIQVIGYLDDDVGLDHQPLRSQVIASLDQLDGILESHVVDGIFLVAAELPIEALRHALECCRRFGVQAFVDLHPFEDLCGHLSVSQFAHSPLLTIAHTNLGEHHAFLKRVFDLSVSLLALIFLAPLFLLIAWLIKICSPGPVFFRQTRVGRNGRTFTMLKFRSMVVGAEHRHGELAVNNEMTGPVFKMRHDPRIYPFGRYLRMWSLDELPQLWNVLRGEMSLVGPRPPLPREVGQYESWQRRRLSVRPGLTCLWQVKGRNRIDFDDWMRLDLEYIDRWSWWLDMKILFLTLPAMLRGQ